MPGTFEYVAPGIQLIGQFGQYQTGIWLCRHQNECMLLEMPDDRDQESFRNRWKTISQYLINNGLRLKFATVTHNEGDHFASFHEFFAQFPEVPIVVHQSFFPDVVGKNIHPADLSAPRLPEPTLSYEQVPLYCFNSKVFETELAGESLYLLHAPKYSLTDTMVIFRGTMITGDWWLGPGDPNPNKVPRRTINESIIFLQHFCREKNYVIHNLFSVHANEWRRDIDFYEILERSLSS